MAGYADGADYMDTGADFCTVGKGATRHVYGLTGEKTWCGKVPGNEASSIGQRCKACVSAIFAHFAPKSSESAIIKPSTTDQSNTDKGETEMAAKTTETTAPAADVEFGEEFADLVDRIRAVAIAGEDTAELVAEAKSMRDAWKGAKAADTNKGRKAMLALIEEAAATPKALSGSVVLSTEAGIPDTDDYTKDPELVELREAAIEKMVTGVKTQLKAGAIARETAQVFIKSRAAVTYKGAPDMLAQSKASKDLSRDTYKAVGESLAKMGVSAEEVSAAVDGFKRSVQNVMQDELVKWTRQLDAPENAAMRERFAKMIEAAQERAERLAIEAAEEAAAERELSGETEDAEDAEPEADTEPEAESEAVEVEPIDAGKVIREAYGLPDESTLERRSTKATGPTADFNELRKIKNGAGKLTAEPGGLSDEELAKMEKEVEAAETVLMRRLMALRAERSRRENGDS